MVLLLLFSLFVLVLCQQHPSVTTQYGVVYGNSSTDIPANYYLGIPFAQPPLSNLRFAAPVDWTASYPAGGLQAYNWGDCCIGGGNTESENCLYLNVITPLNATSSSNLPVIVWIYGGGFTGGCSWGTDGRELVNNNNVVYVSLNYRLQSFGFLALQDALDAGETAGNYGLLDQQAALRWVKNNIKAFGGDPTHVMIFGESAGAISVNNQLILNGSAGLFTAAVMESGFPLARELQFALNQGVQIAKNAGCTGSGLRACLRSKTVAQIQSAQGPFMGNPFQAPGFGPVLDGRAIPASPFTLFENGKWAKVPVLAGTNTDEGTMFVYGDHPTFTDAQYKQYLYTALNDQRTVPFNQSFMDQVYAKYPPSGNDNTSLNQATASSFVGDYSFVCGTRNFMRKISTTTTNFLYRFNHLPLSQNGFVGIYHSCEIPFVYNWNSGMSADDDRFSKQLGVWWTNMAYSGNANQPKTFSFNWPSYTTAADQDVLLVNQFALESGNRKSYCDFWDSLNYYV